MNQRKLQPSRNKREGRYAGKFKQSDDLGGHTRTRLSFLCLDVFHRERRRYRKKVVEEFKRIRDIAAQHNATFIHLKGPVYDR